MVLVPVREQRTDRLVARWQSQRGLWKGAVLAQSVPAAEAKFIVVLYDNPIDLAQMVRIWLGVVDLITVEAIAFQPHREIGLGLHAGTAERRIDCKALN